MADLVRLPRIISVRVVSITFAEAFLLPASGSKWHLHVIETSYREK